MDKEPVLHIFSDKSILYDEKGNAFEFNEGKTSKEAKRRLALIKAKLEEGFLENIIKECQNPEIKLESVNDDQAKIIENLVNSVTSEVGRAIVGLTVLQLTIKAIIPKQSIRLHKGGHSDRDFSWTEGIPMRNIDANYITPILRKYDLLKLNKYGFMMTRSLAENYPYSKLYKAAIRGARNEWLEIIDEVERGELDSLTALKKLIITLVHKSATFTDLTDKAFKYLQSFERTNPSFEACFFIIRSFVERTTYSARVFEVVIHSFYQLLQEERCLLGYLKPMSQMRSANKKHGNIGDIEVLEKEGGMEILEAWDAKYGKSYLRDELEELDDKLKRHPETILAGFITDQTPDLRPEILQRVEEIEEVNGVEILIMEFREWVEYNLERNALEGKNIGLRWLNLIAESICQKRREFAPIDEPTTEWVESFIDCLKI